MPWWDFYKLFTYSFEDDPISKTRRRRRVAGAGVSQPDAIPDIRQDGSYWGGGRGQIRLRDTNDFIDLSTIANRQSRYKEYERLRNVPEIEGAMTAFADESCVAGSTKIATLFDGLKSIKWLADRWAKDPQEFLVYCWDFEKDDYGLGWAFDPRMVKTSKTVKVCLDDGSHFIATPDHKVLLRNGKWIMSEDLKFGDELIPFYRLRPNIWHNDLKHGQFPRIFTFSGWKHQQQFIEEWKTGKTTKEQARLNKATKALSEGLTTRQTAKFMGNQWNSIAKWINDNGFTVKELNQLGKNRDRRRVIGMYSYDEMEVYDLSVKNYENFCTNWGVMHNCQRGDDDNVFRIEVENNEIKKELEWLFFHREMLNMNRAIWTVAKKLFTFGDHFFEIVIDPEAPKDGILKLSELPVESVYRIETTRGRLVEFQQGKEGPDYEALTRAPVVQATEAELMQTKALRFAPEQVIHFKIGDDRKTFYPYGQSLIEPARGPAHQLRLMEDAMVTYRLTRAPERKVFYIDVGQLPAHKAEAFMDRIKDQYRKRKVATSKGGPGAGAVEERWNPMSADEDYWIPVRPNANTRVEQLPGACIALDTKIPLLDGRTLTLQEIIKEYKDGKQLWAYSCNPKNGAPAPGKITWAGVTRKNTKVLKITFDNGEDITCTPDHKFPIIGKDFVQAKDLEIGESVIAFNSRKHPLRSNRKDEYVQIYDHKKKDWVFVHRLNAEYVKKTKFEEVLVFLEKYKDLPRNVVHHRNFNKFDNSPENLCWMNWHDHVAYHGTLPKLCGDKISKGLKNYHANLSDEEKKKRNEVLAEKSKLGIEELSKKLADTVFNKKFRQKQKDGWEKSKVEKLELHENRGEKISKRNVEFWSDIGNKIEAFEKQTIVYPDSVFKFFEERLLQNCHAQTIVEEIKKHEKIIDDLIQSNQHIKRENVDMAKQFSIDHLKKMLSQRGYKSIAEFRKFLGIYEKFQKTSKPGRPKMKWPKKVMDEFMSLLKKGMDIKTILEIINANKELMNELKKSGRNNDFTRNLMNKMIKVFGYKNLAHAREHANSYNHRIVSIEWLDEHIDTGTLTIDGDEELHNFHTFAVSPCYVRNSNLGEIDDALYFRNKLFMSLNFPKDYFNNEDAATTRITLSARDARFARLVERLQSHIVDGLIETAIRHLILRGYPEESFDDLSINMTPPSAWKELSEAEVVTSRINNANGLKGSLMMSDYDIYTKWLKYNDQESQEMIARMKILKLEDLKLQVLAQNPQLLGVGVPGGQTEEEIGAEPGGPGPMLGPEGMPPTPGMPPMPPPTGEPVTGVQSQATGVTLADPTEEELKQYDLEIQSYSSEQDAEEIDYSEM